jgi:hypothetical protein
VDNVDHHLQEGARIMARGGDRGNDKDKKNKKKKKTKK